MYGYIYDVFLKQKIYEKKLIQIENTLTDLGLKGHSIRLSLINNVAHAVEDLLKKGIKTIVAIGSDQLFSKITDQTDLLKGVTLGLIPLGNHQHLANLFGIPEGEQACSILGARLVRSIPLGRVNRGYFIHSAVIYDPNAKIIFHDQFVANATTEQSTTTILNLYATDEKDSPVPTSLSATIAPFHEKRFLKRTKILKPTTLNSQKIIIEEPIGIPVVVDGQKIINTPVTFKTASVKINVIMGKDRKFE